jgi:PAS domain S-box-containing protein
VPLRFPDLRGKKMAIIFKFVIFVFTKRNQQMNDQLQSILDAFHDLLFVFNKTGVIIDYITTNHEDELILPREAFLGRNHRDVLPPKVSNKLDEAFDKLDKGIEQYRFDYSLEVKGEKQWYNAVLSKFDNEDEPRYLGAVRNITARKSNELLLHSVLNISPGGIIVLRSVRESDETITNFEITQVNRTVEQLAGVSEKDLVGQMVTAVVDDQEKEKMVERFTTVVETGQPDEFHYKHVDEQDEEFWYFGSVVKYGDGVVSNFMDITKQKKIEEELRNANQELKELNRQKDKLFSVISHDLKNSISGSSGLYDLILEESEIYSKEELLEYLEILSSRVKSTSLLLEDLLLWSRNQFQSVTLNSEKLNFSEVTTDVFNSVKPNADDKEINLINRVSDQTFVYADDNILKTVLRNLVSNGIKFSNPGGEILVEAKRKDGEVEISVTDRGVGITEDALQKILNKNTNFTSYGTKGEKGSGLGVDLCIDFVELHGGKFWAESEPGEGSTFRFTLPDKAINQVPK